ncbi:MAG: hypothetical protein H9855_12965 [Candidatus Acinetobacter avistercoris]|uniref:hypothetical protein n=1 Tax=Acinetobacter sp. KS-LM10 TaxID=3120518 RepID=UPI001F89B464|nr:hypothetical protein [Candidatus Acinetobacter avistercoris]
MSSTEFDMQAAASISNANARAKKKPIEKSTVLAYRVMIAYRFLLATMGGYLLASLCAIVIGQYFVEYRSSAAMAATLVAFCLHCAAFIWVFMVNKTLKASLGILVPCLILFIIYKVMGN